ncbi:putative receptor-type tyrosine-protein phosphatase alpha [Apostichopus japonicus]|uniref:Putative receptor-type tyrosine-protein phosphatase alpha n=1 Tax=Stichopus japonicus TaxID=307972 RepID=A0A2G8LBE6_STIJA|nr:putative receptor-type tyrosine-protein phosphatase alpha [Apostichopus japonicus]
MCSLRQDVSVVWSDPGLITEAKDANNAAFLVPTLTILAVVLLVTIVIGIIVFRWYLRRKKSDPGATAAPSHDYARHIPLTTHGINAGDAEGDAYEVPKKTSFSALEKTSNCTDSDGYSNGGYVEYEISNKERESDSYDDVENGNKPGIKGSEMNCEVMDIGKATLDKSDLGNPNIRDRGPLPMIDISPIGRSLDECYEELPGTAESKNVVACRVKIKDLPKQLQDKNSVPEDTITDEFKKLPHGQQHPWTVGILKDENQDSGILPVQHPQTFIAAQDPNERTAEMFWKMVWFEKVEFIINLSQPKMSSFQYWPISEGTNKIIGDYTLMWYKSSLEDLYLSIREIKIVKGDKLHEVKLCHFLSWPDDRIPQSVLLIDFMKKVKDLKNTRSHPLLVHCSNGVGATGTFIALYCLMDNLKDSKKTGLSVSSFVNRMRKDRVNMVENEVQYWFLYDCLVVDLLSPEKKVQEDEINLEKQKDEFKILETCRGFSVKHSSFVGRQSIMPKRTDILLFYHSCYSKDAFIMTQSPLPSTAEDFWRMVHDYDCAAIVCLNQMDENDETTCLYWSDIGKIQHGNMLVECTNVEDKDKYCSQRRLVVYSKNTKRTVTVDHYQLIEWSQDSDQTDGIIELIGKIKPITEEKRTIVVHCM